MCSIGIGIGEAHQPMCCTNTMEPPMLMEPFPTLDKVINDQGHQEVWGHTLGKKTPNTIWICYQNVGRLIPIDNGNLKLKVLQQFTQQYHIDIFCFAEHNICWDLLPKQQQLTNQTRGWWENACWSMAFNKQETNPITHQPGGTGLVVLNSLSHRAIHPGGDESGMGVGVGSDFAAKLDKYWG